MLFLIETFLQFTLVQILALPLIWKNNFLFFYFFLAYLFVEFDFDFPYKGAILGA